MPAVCNNFVKLKDDAEKKAQVMQKIGQSHGDRKAMCGAVTRFAAAETMVVKFLEDNKTTCGVPDQAVTSFQSQSRAHAEIPRYGLRRSPAGRNRRR